MVELDPKFLQQLEVVGDNAMPGFERAKLGHWTLKASLGATGRANTVWPAGSPGIDLDAAIDFVEHWYRQRGLRCGYQLFDGQLADGQRHELSALLRDRSYVESPGAEVFWCPIKKVELDVPASDHLVKITMAINPEFGELIGDRDRVVEITAPQDGARFATVTNSHGQLLGGGKSVLHGESLGVLAMLTAEEARRQGIARLVLTHLINDGSARGARWVWLQVVGSNSAAISLYRSAGLTKAHSYRYMFSSKS